MIKFLKGKTTTSGETAVRRCLELPYFAVCPGFKTGSMSPGEGLYEAIEKPEVADNFEEWWANNTLDLGDGRSNKS